MRSDNPTKPGGTSRSSLDVKYRRTDHTAWRTIADETIVVDLEAAMMYGLSASAAFVWQAVESVGDLEELARLLGAKEARWQGVLAELRDFCEELTRLGLLRPAESADEPKPLPSGLRPPSPPSPPGILWQEKIELSAQASCAFLPGQNPLCIQVPGS
jgi:hypothetical protein